MVAGTDLGMAEDAVSQQPEHSGESFLGPHCQQRQVIGKAVRSCEHVELELAVLGDLDPFDHGVRVEVALAQKDLDRTWAGSGARCPSLIHPTRFACNLLQLSKQLVQIVRYVHSPTSPASDVDTRERIMLSASSAAKALKVDLAPL